MGVTEEAPDGRKRKKRRAPRPLKPREEKKSLCGKTRRSLKKGRWRRKAMERGILS